MLFRRIWLTTTINNSTTIPRSLLFLLPYPSVYLMPIYHTMKALQNARESKMRAMWYVQENVSIVQTSVAC
jgi:hypothetical protein